MAAPSPNRERAALRLSLGVSLVIAALAVAWGLAANSQVILFDGACTLIGMALTGVSIAAARLAATGPSRRFPFGLEARTASAGPWPTGSMPCPTTPG